MLIDPDGTNERPLWQNSDPEGFYEARSLAWKRDGTELAFDSTHENYCSINDADIYAVGADGDRYRRITQAPACGDLASYPYGTVHVPVTNATVDTFTGFIYIQGAPVVQQVSLGPGARDEVTFETVADLGEDLLQVAAVVTGSGRQYDVGSAVDVLADGSVTSGPVSVFNPAFSIEARSPTWSQDGEALGYAYGFNGIFAVASEPEPLHFGEPSVPGELIEANIILHMAFGPTAETADQVLFQGTVAGASEGIYRATLGSTEPAQLLFMSDQPFYLIKGLFWLPDGSGFVYSVVEGELLGVQSSNVFLYDFAAGTPQRITRLDGEYAGLLSVSPDGANIVFERSAQLDEFGGSLAEPDLWIVGRAGGAPRLLVENAAAPAWSP